MKKYFSSALFPWHAVHGCECRAWYECVLQLGNANDVGQSFLQLSLNTLQRGVKCNNGRFSKFRKRNMQDNFQHGCVQPSEQELTYLVSLVLNGD